MTRTVASHGVRASHCRSVFVPPLPPPAQFVEPQDSRRQPRVALSPICPQRPRHSRPATHRSASPAARACCRARRRPSRTSSRSRIAGGSASPSGTATARAIRCVDDYPYVPRPLVRPVQPERAQGRLPDHRPAHVPEHHRARAVARSSTAQVPTADDAVREHRRPVQQRVLRPAQPVLLLAVLHAVVRPVPRRRGVQAGRLARQADAGLQRQLPRRGGAGASSTPTCARARRAAARSWPCEEWFVETKLADLEPRLRLRLGRGPARSRSPATSAASSSATPTAASASSAPATPTATSSTSSYFDQREKDTNSGLNTFDDRHQNRSSSPTTTARTSSAPATRRSASVHYNHDEPTFKFDKNGFLVRPDPVGVFQPHRLDVVYLGWAGDGHINRFNITHAVLLGARPRHASTRSPNQPQDINAQMARRRAVVRPRLGPLPHVVLLGLRRRRPATTATPTGFDTIFDNPNFAGGEFSYWQRQPIRLFGVNLVNRESLVPDLRSSKIQGQTQLREPRPAPAQRRHRLRRHAASCG